MARVWAGRTPTTRFSTPQTIPLISGAPAKGRALGMLSARRQGLLLDSELEDGLVGSAAAP